MMSPPVGGGRRVSLTFNSSRVTTETAFSRSIMSNVKCIYCQVLHFGADKSTSFIMAQLVYIGVAFAQFCGGKYDVLAQRVPANR